MVVVEEFKKSSLEERAFSSAMTLPGMDPRAPYSQLFGLGSARTNPITADLLGTDPGQPTQTYENKGFLSFSAD